MDERTPAIPALAEEALAVLASRRQIAPFSARRALTLTDAYRVLPLLRAAFEARGETILGRKIGFTNPGIWAQYGVDAPNWGYVTDATTHELAATPSLRAADFPEPRIEPEIVFGLAAPLAPDMDDAALIARIDWVALGYEIVQSPFPGWKFTPPDCIVVNTLHGALLIGARHAVAPRKAAWLAELPVFTAELSCNGTVVERGGGASVLEGPLSTLRYLAALLARDADNPPLAAGEIVTTGTLTKAMPVSAGETWTTAVSGIPLEAVTLRFA
jgi:2-keto-4-pentenoate hydratase